MVRTYRLDLWVGAHGTHLIPLHQKMFTQVLNRYSDYPSGF